MPKYGKSLDIADNKVAISVLGITLNCPFLFQKKGVHLNYAYNDQLQVLS
jgi:hypothetical protein